MCTNFRCKITIKFPHTQKNFKNICTIQKKAVLLHPLLEIKRGEMAEWSIAAVLKTVELRGSGGSNPSLSAKKKRRNQKWLLLFFFGEDKGPSQPTDGGSYLGKPRTIREINFASESLSSRMPVAEAGRSRWASAARSVPSNPSLPFLRINFAISIIICNFAAQLVDE